MKKRNKLFAFVLVLVLALTLTIPAFAEDASSVTSVIPDCNGADIGQLTEASIAFYTTTDTVIFESGPISSAINDNSCDYLTASYFGPGPDMVVDLIPEYPASEDCYSKSYIQIQ